MSNCIYVGELKKTPDGPVVIRRTAIPAEPPEEHVVRNLPPPVWRGLDRGYFELAVVAGSSMEPTLLDGDSIVIDRRRRHPKNGDIVTIKSALRQPSSIVGRYRRLADGSTWLDKDNRDFNGMPIAAAGYEFDGIVTRIVHRERRRANENFKRIEERRLLHRLVPSGKPFDSSRYGYYKDGLLAAVRELFDIPTSEFAADGRLPWGLFRGHFREDHPHVGAAAGDCATLTLDRDSKIGDLVVFYDAVESPAIGVIRRDFSQVRSREDYDIGWWYSGLPGRVPFRSERAGGTQAKVLRVTSAVTSIAKFSAGETERNA